MKRSLLLISALSLCFWLFSCHSTQVPKTETAVEPAVETKPRVVGDPVASDTKKVVMQTPVSGTAGNDKGIRKDTIKQGVKPTAIIHNAPDQEKIDSIKNAKQKNKK